MTDPSDLVRVKLSDGSFTPDDDAPLIPAGLAAVLNAPDPAAIQRALLARGADTATQLLAELRIPDQN